MGAQMADKGSWLRIRVSEKQRKRLEKEAEAAGITLSQWVRRALDAVANGKLDSGLPGDPEFLQALDRIRAHLRQADDAPALRYAVLVAAELMDDPAGGSPVKP